MFRRLVGASRRRCFLLGLALLAGTAVGCNSGDGTADPHQLAQAGGDNAAFRNLGKRSAFKYRDVPANASSSESSKAP